MANMYDEISLEYWKDYTRWIDSGMSYCITHNGFGYGDDMPRSGRMCFVHASNGCEKLFWGKKKGAKWAYIAAVEEACSASKETLNNFLHAPIKKYRIFTEKAVASFTHKDIATTGIKSEDYAICVDDQKYYVAARMLIGEFIFNFSNNISPDDIKNWFLRVYHDTATVEQLFEIDAEEMISDFTGYRYFFSYIDKLQPRKKYFDLTVTSAVKHSINNCNTAIESNDIKLFTGYIGDVVKIRDLGINIVTWYEEYLLKEVAYTNRSIIVEKKRFSRDIGVDYDIKSFFQDGTPKYIKVKSTKQDMPTEFYLSKKEIAAANKMVEAGERYYIYRIYNINLRTLSASLIIYEWPFDDTYYNIEPEYWSIKAYL